MNTNHSYIAIIACILLTVSFVSADSYWTFDEDAGVIAQDTLGNNSQNTTYFLVGQPGKINNSLFTTINNQLQAAEGNGIDTGIQMADGGVNSWTVGGWFNHNDTTIQYLFSNRNAVGAGTFFRLESNLGNVKGTYRLSYGGASNILSANSSRNDVGEWVFVVLRKSGNVYSLFYNGEIIGSATINNVAGGTLTFFYGDLGIGNFAPGLGLDEAFFYNYTLTEVEIDSLYNAGEGNQLHPLPPPPPPVTSPSSLLRGELSFIGLLAMILGGLTFFVGAPILLLKKIFVEGADDYADVVGRIILLLLSVIIGAIVLVSISAAF